MPVKPSEKEQDYFARMEFNRRKEEEELKHQKMKAEEKRRLRELHHMRCPKCGMELIEVEYRNITLDKCSSCKGLWFDESEFESILAMEKPAVSKMFRIFK